MGLLGKEKNREKQTEGQVLDVTASMQGSLVFKEPVHLRISGHFEGTLETKGDLTIGENAVVQAEILGEEITVKGRVEGKVVAKQSLTVLPPAIVRAELWTPVLHVEPGAKLDGAVHMAQEERGWLSPEEVAEYLEVDLHQVQQWAREGKIPAIQEANRWRFEKAKIDEWVVAQKSS